MTRDREAIRRILCAVDLSDASAHAAAQALALAGWTRAAITALRVAEPIFAPVPGLPAVDQRVTLDQQRHLRDRVAEYFRGAGPIVERDPSPGARDRVAVARAADAGRRRTPHAQAAVLAEFRRYVERSAAMRLDRLCEDTALKARPTVTIVHGKAYVEVLRIAAQTAADLIVIGVHGRNVVDLTLFGSTTDHVIREAACPVLTLRA